jgi:hypothetical protein
VVFLSDQIQCIITESVSPVYIRILGRSTTKRSRDFPLSADSRGKNFAARGLRKFIVGMDFSAVDSMRGKCASRSPRMADEFSRGEYCQLGYLLA